MTERQIKPKEQIQSHLLGLGLDCDDGHVRITKAEDFSILGGSEETHVNMTETVCKTFENLQQRKKRLDDVEPQELSDLLEQNSPEK